MNEKRNKMAEVLGEVAKSMLELYDLAPDDAKDELFRIESQKLDRVTTAVNIAQFLSELDKMVKEATNETE